jgi:hypothetical protein
MRGTQLTETTLLPPQEFTECRVQEKSGHSMLFGHHKVYIAYLSGVETFVVIHGLNIDYLSDLKYLFNKN